jgi:probable rRNA maturation factor
MRKQGSMMKNNKFKSVDETKVFIENEQTSAEFTQAYAQLLKETALCCLKEENMEFGCEVNILITDDASIRDINRQFRDIDNPTDVLSFPMTNIKEGRMADEGGDFDIDEGLLAIGDIVISIETAMKQSEQYGHSLERELAFLTAHGMFHLLGYDHMESSEEEIMMAKQEKVLDKLGLKRE